MDPHLQGNSFLSGVPRWGHGAPKKMNPPTVIQVTRGPIPLKSPSGRMCDASWFNILGPCWAVLGHAGQLGSCKPSLNTFLCKNGAQGLDRSTILSDSLDTQRWWEQGTGNHQGSIVKQSSTLLWYCTLWNWKVWVCLGDYTIFVGTPHQDFSIPQFFVSFLTSAVWGILRIGLPLPPSQAWSAFWPRPRGSLPLQQCRQQLIHMQRLGQIQGMVMDDMSMGGSNG